VNQASLKIFMMFHFPYMQLREFHYKVLGSHSGISPDCYTPLSIKIRTYLFLFRGASWMLHRKPQMHAIAEVTSAVSIITIE